MPVTLIDLPEEFGQVIPVAGGGVGKDVAGGHPLRNVVADALAQSIVVVALVAHRQQAAIFGVEQEEQAVEKDQGGFPDLGHGLVGGVGQRLEQPGEHALEHHAGQALRHPLFVAAAFRQRRFQKRGGRAGAAYEGRPTKQQVEGAQAVLIVGVEQRFQVGLVEGRSPGAGLLVVQAPDSAVGEDAPAELAVGDAVGGGEVTQDLGVG